MEFKKEIQEETKGINFTELMGVLQKSREELNQAKLINEGVKKTHELLRYIVNEVITNEYVHISENWNDVKSKNENLVKEQQSYDEEIEEIEKKLIANLSKEQQKMVIKLLDLQFGKLVIDSQMYFKEGVIAGITDLEFLSKLQEEIHFI